MILFKAFFKWWPVSQAAYEIHTTLIIMIQLGLYRLKTQNSFLTSSNDVKLFY